MKKKQKQIVDYAKTPLRGRSGLPNPHKHTHKHKGSSKIILKGRLRRFYRPNNWFNAQ